MQIDNIFSGNIVVKRETADGRLEKLFVSSPPFSRRGKLSFPRRRESWFSFFQNIVSKKIDTDFTNFHGFIPKFFKKRSKKLKNNII